MIFTSIIKVNAILKNNNEILLLKRNIKDGGFWQTITGHVEEESLEQAIKREVKEETGIDDIRIHEEPVYYFIWKKQKEECVEDIVEVVFLCETSQKEVKLSKEHTDFMWIEIEKAKDVVGKESNKIAIEKAINSITKI